MIHDDLKRVGLLLDLNNGGSTQITIGEVAMAKCQRVYGVVVFIIGASVVHEAPYTSALKVHLSIMIFGTGNNLGDDLVYLSSIHIYD